MWIRRARSMHLSTEDNGDDDAPLSTDQPSSPEARTWRDHMERQCFSSLSAMDWGDLQTSRFIGQFIYFSPVIPFLPSACDWQQCRAQPSIWLSQAATLSAGSDFAGRPRQRTTWEMGR